MFYSENFLHMVEEKKDIEDILSENSLRLVERGFFRGKTNVSRVRDARGRQYILKTGRIHPFQSELLDIAKSLEDTLCFRVPKKIREGEGWLLLEEAEGQPLNDFFSDYPDRVVEISKRISDDYQKVVEALGKKQLLPSPFPQGKEWLFSRLSMWSEPIVTEKLLLSDEVLRVQKRFEDFIQDRGEASFGWFHGNIIGDHILVSWEKPYLLDLELVSRIGKGYYDFLRSLDFFLFVSRRSDEAFASLARWMQQYLGEYDEEEVRLVFTYRCIGVLGWDILHEKVEYFEGEVERKKKIFLRCIRGEY